MNSRSFLTLLLLSVVPTRGTILGSMSAYWTWLGGSQRTLSSAVFGPYTKVFSSTYYPGSLQGAMAWMTNGSFYIFGGQINPSSSTIYEFTNALWQYRFEDETWAWISGFSDPVNEGVFYPGVYGVKGVPAANNTPPARLFGSSVSAGDSLYLFAGSLTFNADDMYNDLWQFNETSLEWVWISGDSTLNSKGIYNQTVSSPGARCEHQGFYDIESNSLFYFGGYGKDAAGGVNYLNDLWKFDTNTANWTFIRGSTIKDSPGMYGIVGFSNQSNDPSSRCSYHLWFQTSSRTAYLFGGQMQESSFQDDFWRLDLESMSWTWLGGSSSEKFGNGVYGTLGLFEPQNYPPSRFRSIFWQESTFLFLFAGEPADSGIASDLWVYWIDENVWAWISGPSVSGDSGTFGPQGVESSTFLPCRTYMSAFAHFTGSYDHFMLYGGRVISSLTLDDFWSLTIDPVACPLGTYKSGNTTCSYCTMGYFSNTSDSSTCFNCPSGLYNTFHGESYCKSCDPGKFSHLASTTCDTCHQGTFSVSSSSSCSECFAGYFSNISGSSVCQICSEGWYSSQNASSSCSVCRFNTFSTSSGASSCQSCP
jgi:hypothetical protein